MRTTTWFLTISVLVGLAALAALDASAAKGGNKGGGGKPGDGGGDAGPAEIAYAIFEGTWELRGLATNGSGTTTLVSGVSDGIPPDPSWSPDGDRIVFRGAMQGTGLYVCDADGSNVVKIHDGSAYDPQWSPAATPDGNAWILFADGATQGDLHLVDPDTGASRTLTNTPNRSEFYSCWSPDATEIAVGVNDQGGVLPRKIVIFRLQVDGAGALVLDEGVAPEDAAYQAVAPRTIVAEGDGVYDFAWLDWSRAGDRIAFSGAETRDGERDIYTVDVTTGARVTVTAAWPGGSRWPTWSPDDGQIAYKRSAKGKNGTGICLIASDGTGTPMYLGEKGAKSLDWMRTAP